MYRKINLKLNKNIDIGFSLGYDIYHINKQYNPTQLKDKIMKGVYVLSEQANTPDINRIYVTRGDNVTDMFGAKCDKMVALEIDGGLYWMDFDITRTSELKMKLYDFIETVMGGKYFASKSGQKGDRKALKPFTKIACHHDDIFDEGRPYHKKTIYNPNTGKLWWTVAELSEHFKIKPRIN